jgi:hypothetical protein
MFGKGGGSEGVDETFAYRSMDGFGAVILGRNMFGPVRGEWLDDSWKGWWGDNPPYHAPTFVLTHHARESLGPCDVSISRLNPTPHPIAVYASSWSSPSTPQHSLPAGRYSLPGPDVHRLDRASFAWRTTTYSLPVCAGALRSPPQAVIR